jgi:hypothetical protein
MKASRKFAVEQGDESHKSAYQWVEPAAVIGLGWLGRILNLGHDGSWQLLNYCSQVGKKEFDIFADSTAISGF